MGSQPCHQTASGAAGPPFLSEGGRTSVSLTFKLDIPL